MKVLQKIIFVSLLLTFYACKKVIVLDIRDSDTKYVIEGVITNEPGLCKVYLSQTKKFNDDNQFVRIAGAVVKVKDNGVETLLPESSPGVYETSLINGTPGHTYELSLVINNQTFTAACTMPQPVSLDTLFVSPGPFNQFKFPTVAYTDPVGLKNSYRFVQYVNGIKDPAIFVENDQFIDGESVSIQLDGGVTEQDDPRSIKTGDMVKVEMMGIDQPIYTYWNTLRSGGGSGSGNSAAPANPITNIKGGALGYFSAHTITSRTVIAP